MSLLFDIGTGAGLAAASGVRPYLPPLLAGALARGDVAIDFEGTEWSFLESPGFLLGVLALGVLVYGAERSAANRPAGGAGDGGRRPGRGTLAIVTGAAGLALGALLFAGSLADGGYAGWVGLIAGPPCAALGWVAVGGLVERARQRLDAGAAGLLSVYADAAALALAAVAILLPPLSFVALIGLLLLVLGARRREDEKYAGLRVLR